jgi:hypothetical protein
MHDFAIGGRILSREITDIGHEAALLQQELAT